MSQIKKLRKLRDNAGAALPDTHQADLEQAWKDWSATRPELNHTPHNERERIVERHLVTSGYNVYNKGWPDLLATKNGDIRLIEVKSSYDIISAHQQALHDVLAEAGLTIEVVRVSSLGTITFTR